MRKVEELENPDSCLNRALPDEMTLILLARDPAAPVAIRAWIEERIRLGKNTPIDREMIEAEKCAQRMDEERANVRRLLGKPDWATA